MLLTKAPVDICQTKSSGILEAASIDAKTEGGEKKAVSTPVCFSLIVTTVSRGL